MGAQSPHLSLQHRWTPARHQGSLYSGKRTPGRPPWSRAPLGAVRWQDGDEAGNSPAVGSAASWGDGTPGQPPSTPTHSHRADSGRLGGWSCCGVGSSRPETATLQGSQAARSRRSAPSRDPAWEAPRGADASRPPGPLPEPGVQGRKARMHTPGQPLEDAAVSSTPAPRPPRRTHGRCSINTCWGGGEGTRRWGRPGSMQGSPPAVPTARPGWGGVPLRGAGGRAVRGGRCAVLSGVARPQWSGPGGGGGGVWGVMGQQHDGVRDQAGPGWPTVQFQRNESQWPELQPHLATSGLLLRAGLAATTSVHRPHVLPHLVRPDSSGLGTASC